MSQQALQIALQHHQNGRFPEAETAYRRILAANPKNAQVLHLLGLLAYQCGHYPAAISEISKAIQLNPRQADYYSNLGLALRANGELDRAISSYKQGLQIVPQDPDIHNNLGAALEAAQDFEGAIAAYRQAIRYAPGNATAYFNLGNALSENGDFQDAIVAYRQALKLSPNDADIYNNLGNALRQRGQPDEAIACYRATLQHKAVYPEAHKHLGWLLHEKGLLSEALTNYRIALGLAPNDAILHYNLGNVFRDLGQSEQAQASYRRALEFNPADADTHNNLGNVLRELGCVDEAITCYREAIKLEPKLHHSKAHLLHQLQYICDWRELPALTEEIRGLIQNVPEAQIPPFAMLAVPGLSSLEHKKCAEHWAMTQFGKISATKQIFDFHSKRTKNPKIRIAYLSADFHEHATAYLMAEVFELHDRSRFETIAYSYGPDDGSPMRKRLLAGFDRFEDLRNVTTEDAAIHIHKAGIDILVDLKGYTAHNRAQILALKPAPIQVNYLGYPGTMGASFIDYLIGDPIVTPHEHADEYTEKLVLLPNSYQANDRQRPLLPKPSRAECGLPEKGFVYCGFNQTFKILPEIFDVWMQLLRDTPESVLWLLQGNRWAEENMKREAEARGVDAKRLIFAPRLGLAEHLARQQQADLLLDTLPYNAHTTTSDALWAAVPVVTCLGDAFTGRVAASLLNAVGLPELITNNLQDYAVLALKLAGDPEELARLKKVLVENRHAATLFDAARFTRDLEAAYEAMWSRWLVGDEPELIRI